MKLFLRDERKWLKEQARLEAERIDERLGNPQAELARLAAIAAEEARTRGNGWCRTGALWPEGLYNGLEKIEDAGEEVKKRKDENERRWLKLKKSAAEEFYVGGGGMDRGAEKKHKDNHKGRHSSTFHIAEGDETHAAYFDHDGENSQSGDSDDGSDEDFPTKYVFVKIFLYC